MGDENDIRKKMEAVRHILDIEKKRSLSKTPDLLALVTAGGGSGSHLILHKMQLHPELVVVNENFFAKEPTGTQHLKNYFAYGYFPLTAEKDQLVPRKELFEKTVSEDGTTSTKFKDGVIPKTLVLNKPPIKRMAYYRNLHYNDIKMLYLFRNPIAYYYTWKKRWENKSMREYGVRPSPEMILYWYERMLLSSLYEFAQFYDPAQDSFVSFDRFVSYPDVTLRGIFKESRIAPINKRQLLKITTCPDCGTKLKLMKDYRIEADSGVRIEEVYYCEKESKALIGPGHYNYRRKEDSTFLNNWKNKESAEQVRKVLQRKIGEPLIEYYEEELYLVDKSGKLFAKRFKDLLERLANFP